MIEKYITILRSRGYRMTPQRLAILGILLDAQRHLSAQEICEMAHQAMPGLTEATVYRTLSFLVGQGLALAAHIGNGQLAYETAERPHHHLICRACGCSMDIDHAWLQKLYQEFQEQTGFRIDGMHVTFFGLCPVCQK